MSPVVQLPEPYYQEFAHHAAAMLMQYGCGTAMLMHLKGMNQSGTYCEEFGILLAALVSVLEHVRTHVPLHAATAKAVLAWTSDRVIRDCPVR